MKFGVPFFLDDRCVQTEDEDVIDARHVRCFDDDRAREFRVVGEARASTASPRSLP